MVVRLMKSNNNNEMFESLNLGGVRMLAHGRPAPLYGGGLQSVGITRD